MSWKQQYFKRRAREIAAEEAGEGRVYLKADELEDGSSYSLDDIWTCLSKAWKAGRAIEKSIDTLDNETREWLLELGLKHWRAIGQAFVEARIEHRTWNNRREISRHGMVNVGSALGGSAELGHQRAEELREWYVDIVGEYADMVGAVSMPDANHQVMGWQEVHGFLSRLWLLYRRGPRTAEDRENLKALVAGLTGASTQRVELWVRQEEGSIEHY